MSADNSKGYPEYDIRLVRDMTEEDITRLLSYAVLGNCYTIGGRKMPNDADLLIDAKAVAKKIKDTASNYGGWFAEELKQAMWEGAMGVFGEYYNLCPKTYVQFLMGWESSEIRKKKRVFISAEYRKFGPKEIGSERTPSVPPMTEAELRQGIVDIVNEFKAGKTFTEVFPYTRKVRRTTGKIIDSSVGDTVNEIMKNYTPLIPAAYVRVADKLGMREEADYLDAMYRKFGVVIEYTNLDW